MSGLVKTVSEVQADRADAVKTLDNVAKALGVLIHIDGTPYGAVSPDSSD
jgi:glutamate/tyrosine decarboxylase-like PLP-dependent enzyme